MHLLASDFRCKGGDGGKNGRTGDSALLVPFGPKYYHLRT